MNAFHLRMIRALVDAPCCCTLVRILARNYAIILQTAYVIEPLSRTLLSHTITCLWATLVRCCTQYSRALVPRACAFIAPRACLPIAPMHLRDATCATMHAIARIVTHSLCLCHSVCLLSCSSSRVRLALLLCSHKHAHVAIKTWHKAPSQATAVGPHDSRWWHHPCIKYINNMTYMFHLPLLNIIYVMNM